MILSDKENICTKCKNAISIGRTKFEGCDFWVEHIICSEISLNGKNKGNRRTCKAFIQKNKEEVEE